MKQVLEAHRSLQSKLSSLSNQSFRQGTAQLLSTLIMLLKVLLNLLEIKEICRPTFSPAQERLQMAKTDPDTEFGIQKRLKIFIFQGRVVGRMQYYRIYRVSVAMMSTAGVGSRSPDISYRMPDLSRWISS